MTNMPKRTDAFSKSLAGSDASNPTTKLLKAIFLPPTVTQREVGQAGGYGFIEMAENSQATETGKKGKPHKAGRNVGQSGGQKGGINVGKKAEAAQDEANLRDAAFIHAAHAAVDRQVYSDMDIAEKFILRHYGAWVKVAPSIDVDRLLERVYVTLTGVATLIGGSVPMDIRRKGTGVMRATVSTSGGKPAVSLQWCEPGGTGPHQRKGARDLGSMVIESAESFAQLQDDASGVIAEAFISDVLDDVMPCPLVGVELRRVGPSTIELVWESSELRVRNKDLKDAEKSLRSAEQDLRALEASKLLADSVSDTAETGLQTYESTIKARNVGQAAVRAALTPISSDLSGLGLGKS